MAVHSNNVSPTPSIHTANSQTRLVGPDGGRKEPTSTLQPRKGKTAPAHSDNKTRDNVKGSPAMAKKILKKTGDSILGGFASLGSGLTGGYSGSA